MGFRMTEDFLFLHQNVRVFPLRRIQVTIHAIVHFFLGGGMGVLFHNNKFTQKTRHVRQRFRINLSCASTIGSRSGYLTYCFCFSVPLTSFHYHCAKCGCAEKQSWGLCNQFHQCASSQNRMTV